MSLVIGGISIGGALAAGAATAVGTYAVGQVLGGSGGGGGGGGGGSPAAAADPFASERPTYQLGLKEFMTNPANYQSDPFGAASQAVPRMDYTATVPGQTTGGKLMSDMLTPGYTFNSSDPSYAFRLSQGAGALASSNAARGLLNSGAAATALLDYGQNAASQEYSAQFARAGMQDTSQQRLQQNQFADQMALNQMDANQRQQYFSNLMGLNANRQTNTANVYSRLAQLAGANIGSPAAAGQLQQQENAAAAAGMQQIIDPITGAVKNAVSNWGTESGSGSGSGITGQVGWSAPVWGANSGSSGGNYFAV